MHGGPDVADEFVKRIENDCIKLTKNMSRTNKPLDLSPSEEREFEEARICHICSEAFVKPDKMVIDHCHINGI